MPQFQAIFEFVFVFLPVFSSMPVPFYIWIFSFASYNIEFDFLLLYFHQYLRHFSAILESEFVFYTFLPRVKAQL